MDDNSSEEKNATVLSEEVRQKIKRGLKAFLRGREVDLDELEMDLMCRKDDYLMYQIGQTVLEATRALQDFDKLRRRNLTDQELWIVDLILRLGTWSKPMAKFIARSTFLMDHLVTYFREFSELNPMALLLTLSAILAVATKSQLGSILAWDLDAEHLLLRELESLASDPGDGYNVATMCVQRWLVSHRANRLKDAGIEGVLNRVLETGEFDEDKRSDINQLLTYDIKIENDPETFKRMRKHVTAPWVICGWRRCLKQDNMYNPSFKRCTRCEVERYCSVECQTAHWNNGHKKVCKHMAPK